jgi:hypothetical protein
VLIRRRVTASATSPSTGPPTRLKPCHAPPAKRATHAPPSAPRAARRSSEDDTAQSVGDEVITPSGRGCIAVKVTPSADVQVSARPSLPRVTTWVTPPSDHAAGDP